MSPGVVFMDVKTEDLNEAIPILKRTRKNITTAVALELGAWFHEDYNPKVREILETGEPKDRIPETRGQYREKKAKRYGFTHAFGYLTGRLISGVMSTPVHIKSMRDGELRLWIDYRNPYYAPYLHGRDDKHGFITAQGIFVPARPFSTVARDDTWNKLGDRIKVLFQKHPKILSDIFRTGRYGPNM